ncbi:glycosyltransferase family 39 protein [Nocardia noduli]|uniref:glycosyltransferase family 39 protein n=1 Tax=Nocardia noduli TaxID=2815722 RepID=UPI001C2456BF|nr:glycosyltransferase family 39 protein [Nocardia noduli]
MTATASAPAAARPRPARRADTRPRTWTARLLFGPITQPRWARPGLFALLGATALLYLWNLTVSGWGNEYYAAAAQAGARSWRALLFGSHDAGNAITVDKPPAALWLMGLSGRLFGFGEFSVLVPQALLGVGSVALLYAAVRRWAGPGAGLIAGAALAATPVAALMFRYDNPDALLTFALIAAAYCTVRAVDANGARWWSGSTGWLVLAGVGVGVGFLTKMLQAFLVLPAFGLVFLVAAAGGFFSRVGKLVTALAALIVTGGWYVLLVELWPARDRPYIGGSTNNSLWELTLGYNGLGRLLGGHGNPGGQSAPAAGARMGGAFGGDTGITRLLRDLMATEVSWLLPAALIGLVAGLWSTRRAPRTDRARAALILWGGWVLGTGLVFSYMSGVIHPYYTVALAPGVAALAAVSVTRLWELRAAASARMVLAAMVVVTGGWAFVLLDRTPEWLPWLRWSIVIGAIVAAVGLLPRIRRARVLPAIVATVGLIAGFAGTASYAVVTTTHPHSGGIPASGPRGDALAGGPPPGGSPTAGQGRAGEPAADAPPAGQRMSREANPGPGAATGGPPGPGPDGPPGIGPNTELEALVRACDRRWSAATVGSFGASGLELRSGASVMAIGGFSGRDDAPTLEEFRAHVAAGDIGYFVTARRTGPRPPRPGGEREKSTGQQIEEWVGAHYAPRTIGDATVYDLTAPTP